MDNLDLLKAHSLLLEMFLELYESYEDAIQRDVGRSGVSELRESLVNFKKNKFFPSLQMMRLSKNDQEETNND